MVCCAFIACVVGQILLVVGMLRGAVLGHRGNELRAANPAVEWRLDPTVGPGAGIASSPAAGFSRIGRRGLVLVAALEVVILLGVVYGIRHIGHERDGGHPGHGTNVHALHR